MGNWNPMGLSRDEFRDHVEKYGAAEALQGEVRARCAELEAALKDCADDLEAEIRDRWGADHPDGVHPANQKRYDRDMAPVLRARTLLSGQQPAPSEPHCGCGTALKCPACTVLRPLGYMQPAPSEPAADRTESIMAEIYDAAKRFAAEGTPVADVRAEDAEHDYDYIRHDGTVALYIEQLQGRVVELEAALKAATAALRALGYTRVASGLDDVLPAAQRVDDSDRDGL